MITPDFGCVSFVALAVTRRPAQATVAAGTSDDVWSPGEGFRDHLPSEVLGHGCSGVAGSFRGATNDPRTSDEPMETASGPTRFANLA
jgi:hypothetical protein